MRRSKTAAMRAEPEIVAIGIAQFILLSLGLMILQMMLKLDHGQTTGTISTFLHHYGVSLLVLPFAGIIFAHLVFRSGWRFADELVRICGIMLAAVIGVYFGVAILFC